MDANKLAATITGFITWAISNPFGFLLWLVGCVAILAVSATILATILAPFAPQFIRPAGDINKWVYVAGFLYLMRGAGR
jgi:hypothetical protein